jgi:hypothetical protein
MKSDALGYPRLGPSRRTLGVTKDDVAVIRHGMVFPAAGGLSVTPDDYMLLPTHRLPRAFGGTGPDGVFEIDTADLGLRLYFRQDSREHGQIEPMGIMTWVEYADAISETRLRWKQTS